DAVAARGPHRVAANVARALGPLTADVVAAVGGELPIEVEIVAVAGAAQVDIDLVAARAARTVIGVAADAFSRAVARLDGAVAGPRARERGERSGRGESRHGDGAEEGAGEHDR